MSPKKSAATAAETGLSDLMQMDDSLDIPANANPEFTASAGDDDEELEGVNSGRVVCYFVHKLNRRGEPLKDNQRILEAGTTFLGRYAGSSVSEKSRFKSRTHRIELIGDQNGFSDGDVVGLPSCGILDKRFQFVPEQTKAQVAYQGSNVISSGEWAGSDSYLYDVNIPKSVNAKIKSKLLPPNYSLKEKKA